MIQIPLKYKYAIINIFHSILGWVLNPTRFGRSYFTTPDKVSSFSEDHDNNLDYILGTCDPISILSFDGDPVYLVFRHRIDITRGYKVWVANRWYAVGTTFIQFRCATPIQLSKHMRDYIEYCRLPLTKESRHTGVVSYRTRYHLYKIYTNFINQYKKEQPHAHGLS